MTLSVETYVKPEDVRSDLKINPADIDSAIIEQAGLYAWYAQLYAKAQRQTDRFEQVLDIKTSQVEKKVRAELGKRVTDRAIREGEIQSQVKTNREVARARQDVSKAKEVETYLKHILEAFKQRRDMLVQTSVGQREEMKGELRIAAIEAGQDKREGRRERVLDRLRARQEQ